MDMTHIRDIIRGALEEDKAARDITSKLLIDAQRVSQAVIIAKEGCVVCGGAVAKEVFLKLDPRIRFRALRKDGEKVPRNTRIAEVSGPSRALLAGERTALNFLSHLSGIATRTRIFVEKTRPYKAKVFDTRKTTPGLRILEKYAVRCGGGENHRMDLNDMILIKDNHRALQRDGSLRESLRRVTISTKKMVAVEVDSLEEFEEILGTDVDIILLDNMKIPQIKQTVRRLKEFKKSLKKSGKKPELEVSGGVDLETIPAIARTGIDRISVGALTHSVKAIDISMEIIP